MIAGTSSARDLSVTFADVEAARLRVRDAIYMSPCAHSATLSASLGTKVFVKLENLQMTGSYKERGALNRLLTLDEGERARGVVCASAGNHAQGVAYHASRLGISSRIVMPEYTPLIKVASTKRFGAEVVLHGQGYDDAYERALTLADEDERVFVHPFDDPAVIAGQGTIGLELLEQNPYLDAVIVPIGGGGLGAGVACALKETNPRIAVYGVEAAAMPAMQRSVAAGKPVDLAPQHTIADGIAVRRVGDHTLRLVAHYFDDIVTVDDEEIASAVLTLLEVEKTVVEGAGATPLAALAAGRLDLAGKKVALVCTGGNIDVTMLSRIIDRGLVKDGRLVRLHTTLPDTPGALTRLTRRVADLRGNVRQIRHDRAFIPGPLGTTQLTVTLETRGHDHIDALIGALVADGVEVERA